MTVVEFTIINNEYEYYVHKCDEKRWCTCCKCRYNEKCDKKGLRRVGLIPNLIDDLTKLKLKFLMLLKGKNND